MEVGQSVSPGAVPEEQETRYVVDGLVFFVGFVPQIVGYSLKPTQRGLLQRYAVGMIAGLAAIVLGVLYLISHGS